jgi:HPr kinase/phosphorylase
MTVGAGDNLGKTQTMHAGALAIGEKGFLILGDPGAGKSRLMLEIISDQKRPRAILVSDDRVILSQKANRIIARSHPLIAGRIEIRGLGIREFPFLESVVLSAVIRLTQEMPTRYPEESELSVSILGVPLPMISFPTQSFSVQHLRAILHSLG